MPFIPHTANDIEEMLKVIGVSSIQDLFDEIPSALFAKELANLAPAMNEMQLSRLMKQRAEQDKRQLSFIGAGAYEHHIPAAVWEVACRGEYMTAYTPYQAEASQGTLQLLYEYQTMMSSLMGLDVSNASLYDGATALAEAVLMAIRLNRQQKTLRVLIPKTVHPHYRQVVNAIVSQQKIELVDLPFDIKTGRISVKDLDVKDFAALVIPQPNFFGILEEVDELTDWAHSHHAYVIGLVNPLTTALLKPPGKWGSKGADIACGDGQPLGVPLASGGPYYGFLCCRQEDVRQLPGRIVGRTTDIDGKTGFVLTLQAREQHIRRGKATSNICTNQGLLVTASTIFMSLLGPEGLKTVALACHQNLELLQEKLKEVHGVEIIFSGISFNEIALRLNKPVDAIQTFFLNKNIHAGYSLKEYYPELGEGLLVCTTEVHSEEDILLFVKTLQAAMS